MERFKKMVSSKKLVGNSTSQNEGISMKPISYFVKGSLKISGPAKVKDQHLSTLCLLIITEAFIQRKYPIHVVNAIFMDLLTQSRLAQLKAKNSSDNFCYWETHVEIKKFINVPCVPLDIQLFNKRSQHSLRLLTEEELFIQVDFNFFIATGDNSYMLMDCLLRQGYTHKKLKGLTIHPLLERTLTSEHMQMNYTFHDLAKKLTMTISAKTGTKMAITMG
uniref:Uncharacterized protein n=1 Tax=Hymenopteran rhabdo-related virus OKIAV25 TaxID=2792581 RepID=A0A7T0Q5C8_9RHAB|nr:hypothetical protein [Hymenopteran rhabdo-related virus OKIAV25]